MHARLNRFIDMEWQALAASLEWFQTEALPGLERRAGFNTLFFGVDPEQGRAAGVTFWDSAEDLRRSAAAEEEVRDEALDRAGADPSKGLVDGYEVALERAGECDAACARLARWEGLTPKRIREALKMFKEDGVPVLEQTPGFAGIFTGISERQGKVLSVILWESPEALQASLEWEREERARAESRAGPHRAVVADSYQVAIAPELQRL